jgi:hypothetical protein
MREIERSVKPKFTGKIQILEENLSQCHMYTSPVQQIPASSR